jgi:1,4-alpha-glucan branching enzyme
VLLLSPHVPLLFMGEEWGARTRFQYFCDFHGELGQGGERGPQGRVRGLLREPGPGGAGPDRRGHLRPLEARLGRAGAPPHDRWLARTRALLRLRAEVLAPRLAAGEARPEGAEAFGGHGIRASWRLADGSRLALLACLGPSGLEGVAAPEVCGAAARMLHESSADVAAALAGSALPPWSAVWFLTEAA